MAALIAAWACWRRSRRERGEQLLRRGWLLLASSALAWGLGEAVWSYHEVGLGHEAPFPSVADIGFLAAVPLSVAAMICFFSPPAGWTSRLRLLADGLIVGTSVLFIGWYGLLGPLYRTGQGTTAAQVISLAYPIGDFVIISMVLLVGARSRAGHHLRLGLVSLGLLSLAASDLAFAWFTQEGIYGAVNLPDVGWVAGYLLIALSAIEPVRTGPARWRRGDLTVLPYLPALGVLSLIAVDAARGRALGGLLLWDACGVFAFMAVRQILTLRENQTLTRNLEATVEGRTAELRHSEERFRSLVQNLSDVVGVVQRDGRIRYVSPSVREVFGYTADQLVGVNLLDLIHPRDVPAVSGFLRDPVPAEGGLAPMGRQVEMQLRRRGGAWRNIELTGTDMSGDPHLGGFLFTTRDVTERRHLEEQLAHQALHDPLTGLANRTLVTDRIEHALARAARHHRPVAVIFVDLDEFKSVNDALGHAIGDQLLRVVASRLEACVRPGDTVARLGGDEFAVLMEEGGEEVAVNVARRLQEAFASPVAIDGNELVVSASVGIAVSTRESAAGELLRNADVAMYRAKSSGRARHAVFRPEMHEAVVRRMILVEELRLALEREEFELHYQPIVDLDTRRTVGFEALARWRHPQRGLLAPQEFITVAEETGLIVPLDKWLLEAAVAQVRQWDALAPQLPPVGLAVNLSGRRFQRPDLVSSVADLLTRTGLTPDRLTLELTESILLEDTDDTIDKLHRLRALGVRVAIDDFGTGFSSLGYLQRFPVDTLKIDKSFVDEIRTARGAQLVRTLVELGRVLGLETVAEGIEQDAQAAVLTAQGCRYGQGYLFSRPLTADAAEWHLRTESRRWCDEPSAISA